MNELAFLVSKPPPYIQSPGPVNPPMIGNGTYTSWPGGVDPSSPLYSSNPIPLSMTGGRRSSRKVTRKNRKANRKAKRNNSRKAERKNSRSSRKNNCRSSRKNNRRAASRNNRKH